MGDPERAASATGKGVRSPDLRRRILGVGACLLVATAGGTGQPTRGHAAVGTRPAAAARAAEAAPAPTLAIVGGRLIDGFGGPPLENAVILIAGTRISAVGPEGTLAVPSGVRTLDANGRTVLPGLMDMHVHLMILGHADYEHWDRVYPARWRDEIMPIAARQLLMAGVTTARDVGAPLAEILTVRDRIARGEIPGPRLFVSGPFLQKETTPLEQAFRWVVQGAADARAKTQQLLAAGVDLIKVIDQDRMSPDELDAIVTTAHAAGKHVTAHAHRVDEIRRALEAGVDCLEHTGLATMPEYPAELMAEVARRNATLYWCPTVAPLLLYQQTVAYPERLDDPRLKADLPPDIYRDIRQSLARPTELEYFRLIPRRIPTLPRKIEQIRRSGATIVVGTDSGVPLNFHNDSTWRELAALVRFGLTPMEAIQAATLWPGRLLKRPDLGTIKPGHVADLIVVDGDPLEDIGVLRHVVHVVKDGKQYK
jgi:imidazolonepropionase-like amidohydrolase